jgi:hypothetical protein
MRICPKPQTWERIYQKLAKYSNAHQLPMPPEPLILGAWQDSSVAEKAVRWRDTVKWAKVNRRSSAVRGIAESDFYHDGFTAGELMEALTQRNRTAEQIYEAGKEWKGQFDFSAGLKALVEKDTTGKWLYKAGADWQVFDYRKGWKALLEKDKSGKSIVSAGFDWRICDHSKALKELVRRDNTGQLIAEAGSLWPVFDFRAGLDALVKKDTGGKHILFASLCWDTTCFEYGKALRALKAMRNGRYYKLALRLWPRGVEQTVRAIKRLKKNAVSFPKELYELKG